MKKERDERGGGRERSIVERFPLFFAFFLSFEDLSFNFLRLITKNSSITITFPATLEGSGRTFNKVGQKGNQYRHAC